MVCVVHTADWQLGKPFGGFPDDVRSALAEARLDVINRIGSVAADNAARHILVAGDVFDNVEPGDRILVQALSRMKCSLRQPRLFRRDLSAPSWLPSAIRRDDGVEQ